jgi:hypothetical protein
MHELRTVTGGPYMVSQVDWPDKSQGQVVKIWVGVPLVTVTVKLRLGGPGAHAVRFPAHSFQFTLPNRFGTGALKR